MPVSAAHQALRAGTAAAHERVDALFGGYDLSNVRDYAAFLQAHAAALLPLERWLDAGGAEAVAPDWANRRRGDRLQADLDELDVPTPDGAPILHPATPAAMAGALYVVEGSRLGGRVLARALPRTFPRRYLDPGTGQPSWPFLLSRLDALLYEPGSTTAAINAARWAFARFEEAGAAWLTGVPA